MRRLTLSLALFLIALTSIGYGQAHIDARGLGLCNAYTIGSRGVSAVGFNPANLGYTEELGFSANLIDLKVIGFNNFMSLSLFNEYFTGDGHGNGKNLEANRLGTDMTHKEYLLSQLPEEGFGFGLGVTVPIPGLNFSLGNYALTSSVEYFQQNFFPKSLFEIMLDGNEVGRSFDLSFGQDVIMIANLGFSFAIPFEKYNVGATVKYLSGIGFARVDSSGGALSTQPDGLESDGFYRFTRAIGGNGMALDIGFNSRLSGNWQYGIAVNNLLGFINWGSDDTFIAKNIGLIENLVPIRSILQISADSTIFAASDISSLDIDSVNATGVFSGDNPFALQQTSVPVPDSLRMNYPAIFRIGASYTYENDFIVFADLSAGLDDYYFADQSWRLALATEWIRFKIIPIRSGIAFGGPYGREASIGAGVHLIWFDADLALKFLGGMSFATAEGIEFGVNFQFKR